MSDSADPPSILFLDANVLISAAWKEGAEVASIWKLPAVQLVTSSYVVGEVQRNLPHIPQIERLRGLMRTVRLLDFDDLPNLPEEVDLPEKDRPVLAGAIQAGTAFLVTGDKKHFGPWFGKTLCSVRILPPSSLVAALPER